MKREISNSHKAGFIALIIFIIFALWFVFGYLRGEAQGSIEIKSPYAEINLGEIHISR